MNDNGLPTEGVELIERVIAGVGTLRFESNPAGTWFTKKGTIAKQARRRYLLNGAEVDSVSSIVGTLDKPALLRWYEDAGLVGGVLAERAGVLNGIPQEDWTDVCRMQGYGTASAMSDATGRGIAIHDGLEAMAKTGEPPNFAHYPAAWHPWLRGAVKAWLALDPDVEEAEQIVCHPTSGYAGRFDLYGVVHHRGRRVRALLDYKTNRGKVFEQAHYQARGYAECLPHCELDPVDAIIVIGIDDEGEFTPHECVVSAEDWADLRRVHLGRKATLARMAEQRKAMRATA